MEITSEQILFRYVCLKNYTVLEKEYINSDEKQKMRSLSFEINIFITKIQMKIVKFSEL